MRALPEHSVVEKKEAGTSFGLDGANDQAVPGSFPHVAEKDFASSDPAPDVRPGFGDRSFAHGDERLFFWIFKHLRTELFEFDVAGNSP